MALLRASGAGHPGDARVNHTVGPTRFCGDFFFRCDSANPGSRAVAVGDRRHGNGLARTEAATRQHFLFRNHLFPEKMALMPKMFLEFWVHTLLRQ